MVEMVDERVESMNVDPKVKEDSSSYVCMEKQQMIWLCIWLFNLDSSFQAVMYISLRVAEIFRLMEEERFVYKKCSIRQSIVRKERVHDVVIL